MMGSGKTAVAEALAVKLGWTAIDTDDIIEKQAGITIAELFSSQGEESFRAAETAAICSLEDKGEPLVVSVGGGAVIRPSNREAMRRLGTVVWLRAQPERLAARVGSGEGRPVLGGGGLGVEGAAARLSELAEQRRPFYEQVADLVVDTDQLVPEEVAGEIAQQLGLFSQT